MEAQEGSVCTIEGLIIEIKAIDPESADAAERVSEAIDKLQCLPEDNSAVNIPIMMIEELAFRLDRPELHERLFAAKRVVDFRHPWQNGREESA